MVKLVDTPASGAGDRKVVEVRVFFWAPNKQNRAKCSVLCFLASHFLPAVSRALRPAHRFMPKACAVPPLSTPKWSKSSNSFNSKPGKTNAILVGPRGLELPGVDVHTKGFLPSINSSCRFPPASARIFSHSARLGIVTLLSSALRLHQL